MLITLIEYAPCSGGPNQMNRIQYTEFERALTFAKLTLPRAALRRACIQSYFVIYTHHGFEKLIPRERLRCQGWCLDWTLINKFRIFTRRKLHARPAMKSGPANTFWAAFVCLFARGRLLFHNISAAFSSETLQMIFAIVLVTLRANK